MIVPDIDPNSILYYIFLDRDLSKTENVNCNVTF